MNTSFGDARRLHVLSLVALLSVVTPPRSRAADGTMSEHEIAPGMVIRGLVTAAGARAFRLIVRGTLVASLTARDGAPPTGYCLVGEWLSVLEAVAAPWCAFAGETSPRNFGPPRRSHSERSPFIARFPARQARLTGPKLVRFLAECTASLGAKDSMRGDEIALVVGTPETRVRIACSGAELHVLVHRERRLVMAGTLSRLDLSRPGRTRCCIGRQWLPELLDWFWAVSDDVDPADLVRFCQGAASDRP